MSDDAFKLLRFTFPGLTCITQLALVALLFEPQGVRALGGALAAGDNMSGAVGVLLALLVASGGLGYILAVIYFAVYWGASQRLAIDHTPIFESLKDESGFKVMDFHDKEISFEIERREAWLMTCQYLDSCMLEPKNIKGVVERLDRIVDVYRGGGASMVGTLVAAVLYLVLACGYCPYGMTWRVGGAMLVFILLGFFQWKSYMYARDALERRANALVIEHIRGKLRDGKEVIMYLQVARGAG